MRKVKLFFISLIAIAITLDTDAFAISITNIANSGVSSIFNSGSDNVLNLEKYISARRGGGSFRGSRSRSSSRSSSRSTSTRSTARPTNPQKTPSFGGTRMSSNAAQSKYGTPRKVQPMTGTNAAGSPVNYNVNHYGGFSSSLMTGYMMGNMAWWMVMPSMLYSRPVYVEKGDGQIDVYPPTFDWGKLFIILLVIGAIVFYIRASRRAKKNMQSNYSQSSFS